MGGEGMSQNRRNRRLETPTRRQKQKSGCLLPIIFGALFIALGVAFYLFYMDTRSIDRRFENPTENTTVWNGTLLDRQYAPFIENGQLMFPVEFVKDYIDETIFWEPESNKLTVTTANQVIRMSTDDLTYYVNHKPFTLDFPVYQLNDSVYMPESLLKDLYGLKAQYYEQTKIAAVDLEKDEHTTATLKCKTRVFLNADNQSGVLTKIEKGAVVSVYEMENSFFNIRTADGIPGYVYYENLENLVKTEGTEQAASEPSEPWTPSNGKINMLWNQVFKVEQNANDNRRVVIDGLDVLSPTWFHLTNAEGDLSNIADKDYVNWAHQNGYQVWALFSNDFDGELTHNALSNTESRENIIKQLLAFVSLYDLDGINIDFESVREADGPYYVQFIRELTPFLKEQGVVVSVDMYIPSPWTAHYQMADVGKVVDYICIMAYDEHWSTSPESGSVASLGWVEEAIENTLERVDSSKVILGMPFFTRLWEEEEVEGQLSVSSKAFGMEGAYENLEENEAVVVWKDLERQNYGEYEKDGKVYKIWLEDETSIEERLKLVQEYDLAGTAAWKQGFEKDNIWPLIKSYLKE